MKTLPNSVAEPGTCLRIGFLVKGTGMALSTLLLLTGCQPNQPPSVQAGSDQTVEEGTNVTLSGGGSDNDGTVASYRWEQIAGPPVAISNKSQPSASFVAPEVDEPVALTFRLTVVDNDGATASDEVSITARLPNQPPSVQAGLDQTVNEGGSVALSGSGSDNDGTVASYQWEQTAGPSVTILNERQASASFVAPEIDGSAVLTFRLTLVDNDGGTASDEVAVTIRDYGRLAVSLSGTVRSYSADYATAGTGISGAAVTVTQYAGLSRTLGVAETDANGKYRIQLRADPGRVNVNATANGFASQSAIIDLTEGSGATADLAMLPVQVVQNFQPENDAGIQLEGQTVVSVPANSLVTASGNAVTGEATAMVTVLDPSRDAAVMPGELVRWNTETGTTDEIESFGAMNVVFADANGERLNLASGKQAGISIPLAAGRRPEDAPATIPLFYWSDTRGYWIEEGEAVLREVADGRWAYTGSVGHFTTWNADSAYDSITMKGCVTDQNGKPVDNVEVTARGSDYVGDSTATTNADGRFEIRVRPDSELQLTAVADTLFSEASTVRTESTDMELPECLVVMSDQGLQDFPMQIKGSSGELQVCVRDHECEDGDKISVDVEGRNIFSGEIVNDWVCDTVEVQAGQSYAVELTALNGTGYKGACSYADANTGEIRVTGENTETQVWRHRGGAGSRARIVVEGLPTELLISLMFSRNNNCEDLGIRNYYQCESSTAAQDKTCEATKAAANEWGAQELSACDCRFIGIGKPSVWCRVEAKKHIPLERHRGGTESRAQSVADELSTKPVSRSFRWEAVCTPFESPQECKTLRDEACKRARAHADEWGAQELSVCDCAPKQFGGWFCAVAARKYVPLEDLEDE